MKNVKCFLMNVSEQIKVNQIYLQFIINLQD